MNLRTPNATKVLGLAGLVALLAAAWFTVLGPQAQRLSETHSTIAATREQNDLLRLQLASLRKQQQELPAQLATDRALEQLFPRTADQPGLFEQVTQAAGDAGIPPAKVTTLAPTAPTLGAEKGEGVGLSSASASTDVGRQTVTITVEAGYADTQRLLENLEDMPRAYLAEAISVGAGSSRGQYLTTVTGAMFVMAPAPRP